MENQESLSESFKKEMEAVTANTIMDPAYRKKKLIFWAIRAVTLVPLYYFLWEYEWVRWSLLLTVPLSLFSLFAIVGTPYLLKKKIEKSKMKMEAADRVIRESEED